MIVVIMSLLQLICGWFDMPSCMYMYMVYMYMATIKWSFALVS